MLAEDEPQSFRLDGIIDHRSGAVSVDVTDLFRTDAGVTQRRRYSPRSTFGRRLSDVVRVCRHPETNYLGVDTRAAGERRIKRLKYQNRAGFAEYHSVPVLRERT